MRDYGGGFGIEVCDGKLSLRHSGGGIEGRVPREEDEWGGRVGGQSQGEGGRGWIAESVGLWVEGERDGEFGLY